MKSILGHAVATAAVPLAFTVTIASGFSVPRALVIIGLVRNNDEKKNYDEFVEFTKRNQLRSWLTSCEALAPLGDIGTEVMTQSMKERTLKKGEVLLVGGDDATEFHIVSDGTFEAYEYDCDGKEVQLLNYAPGDAIGAVSYALGDPNLYSVRATSDKASVWYIADEYVDELLKAKKNVAAGLILSKYTGEGSQIANYLNDYLKRTAALNDFRLFHKRLTKNELRQLAGRLTERSFTFGENVTKVGDYGGTGTLYFVKSGTYEACNADGKVVKTYNSTNEYFGEIGFFLQKPTAITVRVSSPRGILYSLSRKDLDDIIDSDTFLDDKLALLSEKYKEAGMLDKYKEVMDVIAIKSRPKKKPVSLHSTVSIIAAGAYLAAYLPFVCLGLDRDGFISIFDFYQPLSVDACHQIQLSVVLLAISGIMGYFRIPPNAPAARRLPFTLAALSNVLFALVVTSSLNSLPDGYWQFDAFSYLGRAAIGLTFFVEEYFLIAALYNALCGSETGLSSTPGATGRASNIFFVSLIYLIVTVAQAPLVIPVFFSDLTSYEASMSAAFESVNMPAVNFHSFATAVGFVSFLQLVATLQFEKKLSEMQGAVALVSLFFVFNSDAVVTEYKTIFRPHLLPITENSNNYLPEMLAQSHISEIVTGVTVLVFLNAAWKTYVINKKDV